MPDIEIITTEDGSQTLFVPSLNEHYHSVWGAMQESLHVYIDAGFRFVNKNPVHIFEMGFGTGLNALLTLLESQKTGQTVVYQAIEAFPLQKEVYSKLNYASPENQQLFLKLHETEWNTFIKINEDFTIIKIYADLADYEFVPSVFFDLIYFDAFAPDKQPELWTSKIFSKLFCQLNKNGVIMTYSSKGTVKQALREAGFRVFRLPGPDGKRHIVRAIKE